MSGFLIPEKRLPRRASVILVRMLWFLIVAVLSSGCLSATPEITPGPLQTATPTPLPTATPSPLPPGQGSRPFVIGLVRNNPQFDLESAGASLAARLGKLTNMRIVHRTFAAHQELLTAMAGDEVHLAFLPPLTYLYASSRAIAEVAYLSNHFGIYAYGTQYVSNAQNGYAVYFDPNSGLNSAPAAIALVQFSNNRPCWVDPGSAAGYIVPAGILLENQIHIADPSFSQSHAAVIRSLYVKGVCDFGAVFAYSGDPRTSSTVLNDLPDALERIPVIWRSDAVIPNLNISFRKNLDTATKEAVGASLESLANEDDGRQILSAAAEGYSIDALKRVEDSEYDALRKYARLLKIDLSTMIGK